MWYLIIIFRIIEEIESISFSRIFELLNYCYANTNFAGEQRSTHFVNLILGPSLLGWASYLKYKNSTYYNLRSLR